MFDTDVGVNWHLKFRLKIEELKKENEKLKTKNNILERRIKKYENNNIRTARDRKNNHTIKFSGSIYSTGSKT
jgi:cell division protein FtsB